ncbi:unnamed protein product [Linum trigynum]|uniref:Uncharacterized protein n=1 Tax=Linum trigynum TaxID=586398 RepID=A0AAV2GLH2_9ROSI
MIFKSSPPPPRHRDPQPPDCWRARVTLEDLLPALLLYDDLPPPPRIPPRLTLPHSTSRRLLWYGENDIYLSSKDGWLLVTRPKPCAPIELYLLNPITKSTVALPPIPFRARHDRRPQLLP